MSRLLRRLQRGYTAVELMMAISVFGIGVAGIISMEKVTSVSNQHAKNLAIATHIAESWMDMLATDAVTWNHPRTGDVSVFTDLNNTTWLQFVRPNADAAANWFLPPDSLSGANALSFGPAFDALGAPIAQGTGAAAFCSHLRLSWLYQPTANGNGLIRAEVRVFWRRDGQPFTQDMCSAAAVAAVSAADAPNTFHFVQKITAIRENSN